MEGFPGKKQKTEEVPDRIKHAPIFDEEGNEIVFPERMPGKVRPKMLSLKDKQYLEAVKEEQIDLANSQAKEIPESEVPAANDKYGYSKTVESRKHTKSEVEDWKTRHEREKEERLDELQKRFG